MGERWSRRLGLAKGRFRLVGFSSTSHCHTQDEKTEYGIFLFRHIYAASAHLASSRPPRRRLDPACVPRTPQSCCLIVVEYSGRGDADRWWHGAWLVALHSFGAFIGGSMVGTLAATATPLARAERHGRHVSLCACGGREMPSIHLAHNTAHRCASVPARRQHVCKGQCPQRSYPVPRRERLRSERRACSDVLCWSLRAVVGVARFMCSSARRVAASLPFAGEVAVRGLTGCG